MKKFLLASLLLYMFVFSANTTRAQISGPSTACVHDFTPYNCDQSSTSYQWHVEPMYDVMISDSTIQNPTMDFYTAGTYTVTIYTTGPTNTFTTTVFVSPGPIIMTNGNVSVCEGGTLSLGATGGMTYSWSGPNGFSSTLSYPFIPNANPANAGTYTVSTADIYGCTNYATVDVIVLPVPAGTISVSSTPGCAPVCAGMLVTSPDSLSIINWDMGDGVIESNANDTIQHCYLADGFYDVTCIITSTNGCQASILYSNAAAVHSSSNINGTVYDEFSAPVTSGNVFLFGYSAVYGAFDTVAVTSLDASGQYSFPGVPANSYLVKCVADPITYPLYIGTYYGNVAYWPVATLINSVCDSTYTADINLSQGALMTGTGVISGYVLEGIGYGQRIANVNHIAAPGGPLKGVCVNLKKVPGGGYQAQTQTDSLGYYEFVNIPTGDYTVEVDIPGLVADSTYSYFLTVDPFAFISGANNNSIMSNAYSGVDFVADSTTIFATNTAIGIKENKNTVSNINVFPNPAKNKINIVAGKTTDEMQIQLFDNIGTLVKKENVKAGESILSVEGTSPGIYLLKVITTNGISTKAVIIQN